RAPAAAKPASPTPTATRPDAPEDRVRKVHERFVAARQQTRESPNVSVATLERSMREAEARLRQKHGNRRIDFDVVIKNGKAVLKPIVR
ncbi:MAG TPA: MXAN_5187 C-terminal domain-containing protein, partial [Polyangiaceae bacterium]|nr:MXAN_5187 C-terminal domain-containing protein [Polyangiaceae bacterium]